VHRNDDKRVPSKEDPGDVARDAAVWSNCIVKPSGLLGIGVVIAVSASAGWHLRARWVEETALSRTPAEAASVVSAQPVSVQRHGAPPVLQVQPALPAQPTRGTGGLSQAMHACPEAAEATPTGAANRVPLLRALREGTETEQHSALMALLSAGGNLPLDTLHEVFASDASESVRLLAFIAYTDAIADDVDATRAAFDIALHSSSAALRDEARRRSAELEGLRALASMPLRGTR
jgi:hypothetical protein